MFGCFLYVLLRTGEDSEVDLVLDVVHDRLSLLGRSALALFRFFRKNKQQQQQSTEDNNINDTIENKKSIPQLVYDIYLAPLWGRNVRTF